MKKISAEEFAKIEEATISNIIEKVTGGGIPTAREQAILAAAKAKEGKPGQPSAGYATTLEELATACGVDRRTLSNTKKRLAKQIKEQKSVLVRADGRYCIAEWIKFLDRHGVRGRRKDAQMEDERSVRLDLLRIERDQKRFNLEKAKSQSLPVAQYQAALQAMCTALLASINAFVGRVNPLLEGLDFHDRQAKLEEEIEILKRQIHVADYIPAPTPGVE